MTINLLAMASQENTWLFYSDYAGNIYAQRWNGNQWNAIANPVATDCTTMQSSTAAGFNHLAFGTTTGSVKYADAVYGAYRDNQNELKGLYFKPDGSQINQPTPLDNNLTSGPAIPANQPTGQLSIFYCKADGIYAYFFNDAEVLIQKIVSTTINIHFKPVVFCFGGEFFILFSDTQSGRYPVPITKFVKGNLNQWSQPANFPALQTPVLCIEAKNFGNYVHLSYASHDGHHIAYSNAPASNAWTNLKLSNSLGVIDITEFSGQLHFTYMQTSRTLINDSFYINDDPSNWSLGKMAIQTLNGADGKTTAPLMSTNGPDVVSANLAANNYQQQHICYVDSKNILQHIWYDINNGWKTNPIQTI